VTSPVAGDFEGAAVALMAPGGTGESGDGALPLKPSAAKPKSALAFSITVGGVDEVFDSSVSLGALGLAGGLSVTAILLRFGLAKVALLSGDNKPL
jgi:hypothetical protein